MRNHFEDFWGLYLMAAVSIALIGLGILADRQHRKAVAACYDQGMVLVDTSAGWRCAPLHSMGAAS
jgi:hypothetical protein